MREWTPSAPTTNDARSSRTVPSPSRAVTPTTRPASSVRTPVTLIPLSKRAPASTAAETRMVSSTWRRGASRKSTPARSFTVFRRTEPSPRWNATVRISGAPLSTTASSSPHRASWTRPPRAMAWVESVSLGNVARSTTRTSSPWFASSMAVAAPAQRAPTTMTSCCSSPALPGRVESVMEPPCGSGRRRAWRCLGEVLMIRVSADAGHRARHRWARRPDRAIHRPRGQRCGASSRRALSSPSFHGGVELPWLADARELVGAAPLEPQAGPGHEVPDRPRDPDLAGGRSGGDAGPDVDAEAGDVVAEPLDLGGVDPDPDRKLEAGDGPPQRVRAAHGAGRPVERREQPVAGGDDLVAPEPCEIVAGEFGEAAKGLSPTCVAQALGEVRGADHVREQHRRQEAVGRRLGRGAGDELLDRVEDRLLVDVHEVVAALQHDQLGTGNALCEGLALGEGEHPVTAAMDDPGGCVDRWQDRADVDQVARLDGVSCRVGRRAVAFVARKQAEVTAVAPARRQAAQDAAGAPAVPSPGRHRGDVVAEPVGIGVEQDQPL